MIDKVKQYIESSIEKAKKVLKPKETSNFADNLRVARQQARINILLRSVFFGIILVNAGCSEEDLAKAKGTVTLTNRFEDRDKYDALGEKKIAVLLTNFRDTELPDISPEEVHQYLIDDMNDYFQKSSYGQMSITGDVYGWYELGREASCEYMYEYPAKMADIPFDEYDQIITIAPFKEGSEKCSWAGINNMGALTMVNSASLFYWNPHAVTVHELGHSMGFDLLHSAYAQCDSPNVPDDYSGCEIDEYGDLFDPMGGKTYTTFTHNSVHLKSLEWLPEDDIQTISSDGVYTISKLSSEKGLRALRIPRENHRDYLYIEARSKKNDDNDDNDDFVPEYVQDRIEQYTNVYDGALLYSTDLIGRTSGWINSVLLHANQAPEKNFKRGFSALELNQEFLDRASQKAVKVIEITEDSLTVSINSIGMQEDQLKPEIEINSYELSDDVLEFTSQASDESGIAYVDYYISSVSGEGQFKSHLERSLTPPYTVSLDLNNYVDGIAYEIYSVACDNNEYSNCNASEKIKVEARNDRDNEDPKISSYTLPAWEGIYEKYVPFNIEASDDHAIKSIKLVYYDKRVQFDTSFNLYSTNHKEMKTSIHIDRSYDFLPGTYQGVIVITDLVGNTDGVPFKFKVE